MKKVNVYPAQEVAAEHITNVQDYIEQAFSTFAFDFMQSTSGVFVGLSATSGGVSTVNISTGSLFTSNENGWYAFGTLESSTGVVMSLPATGSRTDLIAAKYVEVLDTASGVFVLLDTVTRSEGIQSLYSRRFGGIQFDIFQNTTASSTPYGYMPICEVTMNSSAITSLSDVRMFCRIQRFSTDTQQNFKSMFFSGF